MATMVDALGHRTVFTRQDKITVALAAITTVAVLGTMVDINETGPPQSGEAPAAEMPVDAVYE